MGKKWYLIGIFLLGNSGVVGTESFIEVPQKASVSKKSKQSRSKREQRLAQLRAERIHAFNKEMKLLLELSDSSFWTVCDFVENNKAGMIAQLSSAELDELLERETFWEKQSERRCVELETELARLRRTCTIKK